MIERLLKILKKEHIRTALKDIQLEGGSVPVRDLLAIDDYVEGRISRNEFLKRMVNTPKHLPDAEQEAEELGLTGVSKELYPDWQNGKITTEEYVREVLQGLKIM